MLHWLGNRKTVGLACSPNPAITTDRMIDLGENSHCNIKNYSFVEYNMDTVKKVVNFTLNNIGVDMSAKRGESTHASKQAVDKNQAGTSEINTASTIKGLTHLSPDCPGLHGAGSSMDIFPLSFHDLFSNIQTSKSQYIVIPLLQRTYCWTDKQIHGWWRDASRLLENEQDEVASNEADCIKNRHGTGKCMFRKYEPECVDNDTRIGDSGDGDCAIGLSSSSHVSPIASGNILNDVRSKGYQGEHHTENAVFSSKDSNLICIDGQQRVTTHLLLYISIRDAALEILFRLYIQRDQESSAQSGNVVLIDNAIDRTSALIDRLEKILFLRSDNMLAMHQYIDGLVQRLVETDRRVHSDCGKDYEFGISLKEGAMLPNSIACVLLPAFIDRAPFFELLLERRLIFQVAMYIRKSNQTKLDVELSGASALENLSMTVEYIKKNSSYVFRASKRAVGTRQKATKSYFDAQIHSTVKRRSIEQSKVCAAVDAIIRVFESCNYMYLMYCEITTPIINMAQVFLYLQESSMFSLGALLYNPSPGEKFRLSDWVRNLLLAPVVMRYDLAKQEHYYRTMWLEPLETRKIELLPRLDHLSSHGLVDDEREVLFDHVAMDMKPKSKFFNRPLSKDVKADGEQTPTRNELCLDRLIEDYLRSKERVLYGVSPTLELDEQREWDDGIVEPPTDSVGFGMHSHSGGIACNRIEEFESEADDADAVVQNEVIPADSAQQKENNSQSMKNVGVSHSLPHPSIQSQPPATSVVEKRFVSKLEGTLLNMKTRYAKIEDPMCKFPLPPPQVFVYGRVVSLLEALQIKYEHEQKQQENLPSMSTNSIPHISSICYLQDTSNVDIAKCPDICIGEDVCTSVLKELAEYSKIRVEKY